MKISDVTILKSLNPIEVEPSPSNNSYEFLYDLQNNKKFIKGLDSIRKEYGVPDTGFDINKECGRLITWESHKGHLYGYCKGCRGKKGVKEPEVKEPLMKVFNGAKINKKPVAEAIRDGVIGYVVNSSGLVDKTNAQIEKDIEKYTSRLSQLIDDRADGLITPEMYSMKFTEYNNTLTNLRLQLKENTQNNEFLDVEGFKEFFDGSQNLEYYYEHALKDERRKLLRFAFENIAYANNELDYKFTNAYKLLYKAVEVTNSSEIKNPKELQKYISEPDDLVASKTKNDSYRAIRSSWLSMSV